jgi:uncharacterized protein
MPTIRELVAAIAQRDGVEAAILLGHDGMVIDARATNGLNAEHLSAHVPAIVAAAEDLGAHGARGALRTVIAEYEQGVALVSALTADATLLVLVHPAANVGSLLFDLRRQRANIASLV